MAVDVVGCVCTTAPVDVAVVAADVVAVVVVAGCGRTSDAAMGLLVVVVVLGIAVEYTG